MTSELWPEIAALAEESQQAVTEFTPPANPPAEDRALALLPDGVGDVIRLYVAARTGEPVELTPVEASLLQRALNDWLKLYAACYGHEIDAEFTVRETAELFVQTHNLVDTVQLLTGIPERDRSEPWNRRKAQ